MTSEILFIHSVEAYIGSMIKLTLKTCANRSDGDVTCSLNVASAMMNKRGWQPPTSHYSKREEVITMTYQTPTVTQTIAATTAVQGAGNMKPTGICKDGGHGTSSGAYEVDE